MIYIDLMGGLGNQLFQIFCIISYSFTYKVPFKIKATKMDNFSPLDNVSRRPTYWDNFLNSLNIFLYDGNINLRTWREPDFTYNMIPHYQENFRIFGYFQSYKYFDQQYDNIIRFIKLEEQKLEIREKYEKYLNSSGKKLISMHFRIGDYVKRPDVHPVLEVGYYISALNYLFKSEENIENIEEKYDILYFGEERDDVKIKENIRSIQEEFPKLNFIQCPYEIVDWEQMLMMSNCQHNIMANSSFSWWGAYFNSNVERKVCYPSVWFGLAMANNLKDLFPEKWIKIDI